MRHLTAGHLDSFQQQASGLFAFIIGLLLIIALALAVVVLLATGPHAL